MLHVAVNAISLSDTFFKKLPRTHSAVAFSKTKPAALGFDLDVKAKISELKPPDTQNPVISTITGFCHALCTFIEIYANQTVSPVMFHKVGSRRRRYEALPVGCPR